MSQQSTATLALKDRHGKLTAYALQCGYVEEFVGNKGSERINLKLSYSDGCYRVNGFIDYYDSRPSTHVSTSFKSINKARSYCEIKTKNK
jgi:hypothetical protein